MPFSDAEVLVSGEIPVEPSGTENRIPSRIAEGIERLEYEGRGVEPSVCGGVIQGDASTGRVRPVIRDIRIGAIDTGRGVHRESGSPCHDGTKLPSAHHSIQKSIADVDASALAERQIVQSRRHQAVAIVKRRESALAALTVSVLPEERVAIGGTDTAGLIDGLRPGVGHQSGNAVGEALGQFRAHGVVVPVAAVLNENKQAEVRIGRAAGYGSGTWNRGAHAAVGLEVAADRTYITLDVHQPLH